MVQCCGAERLTHYCADCGKRLYQDDGLFGLLVHCEKTARIMETRSTNARWGKEQAAKDEKDGRRWRAWATDLLALLKGAEHE
jgi:hypothetical protein